MIKFRAWYMPFGKYGAMQEMVYSRASHILALAETEPEKYIPEQFTGLKDVNGKDIYVGDIVHFGSIWCVGDEYDPREEEHIGAVEYCQDYAGYVVNCNGKIYPLEQVISFDGYSVQGNVHENPELLEK
ncbi:YopX family protein [Lactiplantibacillus plantarum]|uniref:YopX family protein n=1 Tax=Lactiplantibacillus plantarum TaxID=1590 RepID=UPI0020A21196|nr:YopX family protein [Lactiplantibacillus plantarum]USZ59634.1 YopX family protein [Lactiplantibacillus plantarum]